MPEKSENSGEEGVEDGVQKSVEKGNGGESVPVVSRIERGCRAGGEKGCGKSGEKSGGEVCEKSGIAEKDNKKMWEGSVERSQNEGQEKGCEGAGKKHNKFDGGGQDFWQEGRVC